MRLTRFAILAPMRFILTTEEDAPEIVAAAIDRTTKASPSTLLLLSGGSNIDRIVAIRRHLDVTGGQVTVGLVDERFGPPGHPDSNWAQLEAAGFDFTGVDTLPVLQPGLSLTETADRYGARLEAALAAPATCIGLFGLGEDGHTAGILVGSPALDSTEIVCGYSGPDFNRITLSKTAIRRLDAGLLLAYGQRKRAQLDRLEQSLDSREQPAQVLKDIKELMVYNDYKGATT